jgi:hypothetical protein
MSDYRAWGFVSDEIKRIEDTIHRMNDVRKGLLAAFQSDDTASVAVAGCLVMAVGAILGHEGQAIVGAASVVTGGLLAGVSTYVRQRTREISPRTACELLKVDHQINELTTTMGVLESIRSDDNLAQEFMRSRLGLPPGLPSNRALQDGLTSDQADLPWRETPRVLPPKGASSVSDPVDAHFDIQGGDVL